MAEERKRRATQDIMEKAKMQKELAKKAAEVCTPAGVSLRVVVYCAWQTGRGTVLYIMMPKPQSSWLQCICNH